MNHRRGLPRVCTDMDEIDKQITTLSWKGNKQAEDEGQLPWKGTARREEQEEVGFRAVG